jgi:thioester reductase-like protein
MRLLVAGITGQLGAGIVEAEAQALLDYVALVRPMGSRTAEERVRAAYPEHPRLAATAVAGDVTQQNWGLDAATIRHLATTVDGVANLAGETNWAAPRRQLDAVNVLGAIHGHELTCALEESAGARKLYCHASTIHTAGGMTGRLAEEQFGPDEHRTAYELSKWLAETALLERARRPDGPAACIARIGGLLGSSVTGATRRRNSLYMLADQLDAVPLGLLPLGSHGRVDMLPRDIAGRLLGEGLLALHAAPPEQPQIVHVCAGESAPTTRAVLSVLDSLALVYRRRAPRTLHVPVEWILAVSEQLTRYHDQSRSWSNALVGLRYLSLDRVFERSRLAQLVPGGLPVVSVEDIVRSAFELPVAQPQACGPALSFARFTG